MSKMTTQEFLDHLGIEVGIPFHVDGFRPHCIHVVKENMKLYFKPINNATESWTESAYNVGYLLDKEITLLPKYTLTEMEKYAILAIDPMWKSAYRNDVREIWLENFEDGVNTTNSGLNRLLFPFWKERERIDLDELRKYV